ncbi:MULTISPECIES: hypothetical protein [Pacificibacter]|uniref:hypothetical protein n=1 Tax=Pacificibacter TaxID=1042323 RepID=UPI001C08A1E1|nr:MULTISPECIES: hypothetical protein [Pacificibacter]MBU2937637.1 hypothetical protein [Pacificibacter marinus]MDO6616932.1 hypothetical protein [Pacificibacter sp. 1_MG-2023]
MQFLLKATAASLFVTFGAQSQTADLDLRIPQPFGNTAIPLVEGAEEIIVDVPSPLHPTRYQRGVLGDWIYVIYPNGAAHVMSNAGRHRNLFDVTCTEGLSCLILGADGAESTIYATGEKRPAPPAPTNAQDVAQFVARWILAETGSRGDTQLDNLVSDEASEQGQSDIGLVTLTSEIAVDALAPQGADDVSLVEEDPDADAQNLEDLVEVDEPDPQPLDALNASCPDLAAFVPDDCHQSVELIVSSSPVEPAPKRDAAIQPQAGADPQTPPEPVQETAQQTFWERLDLACAITGTTSLQDASGAGTLQFAKPRASLGCSTKLTPRLSFRFALVGYANSSDKATSDPDFTYAFNYQVSDKINVGYSNYSAQFNGPNGNFFDGLKDGNLRASYKLPVIELPFDKKIPCTASIGFPNPASESLNFSCGYAVNDRLRVGGTAYLYAPGVQTSYQPDYSYTASYKIADDWSLSYSNYSNNRWAWNRGDAPGPGILGGNLSVTYKFKF